MAGGGLWVDLPFIVHRSNALEALVDRLAAIVAKPVGPPSQAEPIVVQSRGMERWLSMELARRLGIWAHPQFPFPRNLVERILSEVLGEEPHAERPFSRESLAWSIAAVLPTLTGTSPFSSLHDYLEGDESGLRRLQLARRIADLFDQYAVYRPELVLGWEQGNDGGWQADLWRTLVERCDGRHLAARVDEGREGWPDIRGRQQQPGQGHGRFDPGDRRR
jgi:exodeoxyribonuclease V gamma subunit